MADEIDTATVPVVEERLVVGKRIVEDGIVRVRTVVDEREAIVRGDLLHGRVEVERVVLNVEVDAVPPVRDEGDTIVVPVVREELVVTRRLILTEEVRLRRISTTETIAETVTLRSQRAVIERDVTSAPQSSRESPKE